VRRGGPLPLAPPCLDRSAHEKVPGVTEDQQAQRGHDPVAVGTIECLAQEPDEGNAIPDDALDLFAENHGIGLRVVVALRDEAEGAVAQGVDRNDPVGDDGWVAGTDLIGHDITNGNLADGCGLDHHERARRQRRFHRAREDRHRHGTGELGHRYDGGGHEQNQPEESDCETATDGAEHAEAGSCLRRVLRHDQPQL
jgi:hypothetical protein